MKILIYSLMALAATLIVFNATQIDINSLTKGKSFVALVGIIMSCCTILLLTIFLQSKKINALDKK